MKEEEADKLFGKKNSREDVSEKWSQVKSGNIYQWGDSGGIFFLFGESSGNIQEHLLSTYKDKNTDLKYKYLVTRSSKVNPAKVLDVVIAESKPLFFGFHMIMTTVMYYETINQRDIILSSTRSIVNV